MPEQLTKHPEVTLQVLRSAGATCGKGAPQDILKQCPSQQFCKFPGGEVCIYGLADAGRMTQISGNDWALVQQALQVRPQAREVGGGGETVLAGGVGLLVGAALVFTAMRFMQRRR
jgi:hypothetical protein